jgi:integral membrane protein
MPKRIIHRLRMVGLGEGASLLILLGVAMPLKYAAGRPEAVSVAGAAHGVLFLLYLAMLTHAWMALRWPFARVVLLVVAGVMPFGTIIADAWLRRYEAAVADG